MQLSAARFQLRPWREGDESSLLRNADNRNIWINLPTHFPSPYTLTHAQEWINLRKNDTAPHQHFAIAMNESVIGAIGLNLKSGIYEGTAEIGFWLGEDFWGQGIITEAVSLMTAYGLHELNLRRISAQVYAWNPASQRVLEKCGYTLEGTLRDACIKDGKIVDDLVFACVKRNR